MARARKLPPSSLVGAPNWDCDAVAEAFLIADAAREARAETAAAEHVVGHDHGGIVGILVGHLEGLAGDEEGVLLVGSLDLLVGGIDLPVSWT